LRAQRIADRLSASSVAADIAIVHFHVRRDHFVRFSQAADPPIASTSR
jgi:hypothetical protein